MKHFTKPIKVDAKTIGASPACHYLAILLNRDDLLTIWQKHKVLSIVKKFCNHCEDIKNADLVYKEFYLNELHNHFKNQIKTKKFPTVVETVLLNVIKYFRYK